MRFCFHYICILDTQLDQYQIGLNRSIAIINKIKVSQINKSIVCSKDQDNFSEEGKMNCGKCLDFNKYAYNFICALFCYAMVQENNFLANFH